MSERKSKWIALLGGIGALCAVCCSLPILSLVGFASLEALFCENEILQKAGLFMAAGALFYFLSRKIRTASSCQVDCNCRKG